MKGFFLVIMMIGLLIVSLLVVRNLSTRQTLEGDISQIETMDQAKELTDFVNQRAKEMERKLQNAQ
jgi:competence protein ComGC